MDEILVLAEQRNGEIRDITFEMLGKGRELADRRGARLTVFLMGDQTSAMAESLAPYADSVMVAEDARFARFNSESYQQLLSPAIRARNPLLVMIGHTSYGIELAPGLATELDLALITDVTGVDLEGDTLVALRPIYGGKAMARVRAKGERAIITVESGAFAAASPGPAAGEITRIDVPPFEWPGRKQVLGFVEAPAEDVDITQSDVVVSVGRGISDPENLPMVEELAKALGGVLACSRPVVDKKWLPKSRQVGISGKTVQPKLYLAVGISGAFQHLVGMKGSKTIIAINKDPNAPIFRVADYGVVGDLFKVVPALTERLSRMKKAA